MPSSPQPGPTRPTIADGPTPGAGGEAPPAPAAVVRLELPPRTVAKAVLVLVAAPVALWLLAQVTTILIELLVALLLTAALDPAVTRLERRGLPRPASVALTVLGLLGALALVLGLAVPALVEQGAGFVRDLPSYAERAEGVLAPYPPLQQRLQEAVGAGSADPAGLFGGILTAAGGVVDVATAGVLVAVMTAYLLIDGERTYDWTVRFLPRAHRVRARRLLPEISRVVGGYVLGQAVTSLLFGAFTFAVAVAVGLPQPFLLAAVAAVADAVPLVGVVIATVPPVLLALLDSPAKAGLVLALFVACNQLESHLLVPRIYGQARGISPFAALIAALVGWRLLGIVGILIALPLAAIVPAAERIWGAAMTPADRAAAAAPPPEPERPAGAGRRTGPPRRRGAGRERG